MEVYVVKSVVDRDAKLLVNLVEHHCVQRVLDNCVDAGDPGTHPCSLLQDQSTKPAVEFPVRLGGPFRARQKSRWWSRCSLMPAQSTLLELTYY